MLAALHHHLVEVPFIKIAPGHTCSSPDATLQAIESLAAGGGMQVSRRINLDHGGVLLADAETQLAEIKLPCSSVTVVFRGKVFNIQEICSLYNGLDNCSWNEAELLLALYQQGFTDTYGDCSDQPATLMSCLEGDFACLLYDSSREYFLAARSASGKVPLYWGTDMLEGDNLLVSTLAGHLSPFPAGIIFESQKGGGMGRSRVLNMRGQTPNARRVQLLSKTDSHGHLCGLKLKSGSGRDLTATSMDMASPNAY
eukprot:jgi/Botrbrau1/6901/Bobra.67_3s0020.1